MSGLNTRMQPWLTISPLLDAYGVPWIAMRPPPGQSVSTSLKPDSPRANTPYGPVGLACGTCAQM